MSVDYSADLPALYATFGEPVTIAGSPITAIFEGGYADALEIAGTRPTLRCVASDVSAVATGAAVVRAGVNFIVREKRPLPPDEIEARLVLERA